MYKIALKDVGQDRITTDRTTEAGHEKQAVAKAREMISLILEYDDFEIKFIGSGCYVITHFNILVGSFELTKEH